MSKGSGVVLIERTVGDKTKLALSKGSGVVKMIERTVGHKTEVSFKQGVGGGGQDD